MPNQTPSRAYNWAAMFVAYCNSCPLDEIAQVYGVELITLQQRVAREDWAKLRASSPMIASDSQAMIASPSAGLLKLKIIEENRQKNLAVFVELRDHLVEIVSKLKNGTLKMEKFFNNAKGGFVIREEAEPSPGDMVNIATYARTIADGTYRALGDFQAQEKAGQDSPAGQAAPPAITIILPGVISAPRDQRNITEVASQVIDLRDVRSSETSASSPGEAPPNSAD